MNRRNLLRLALALPIAGIAAAQQMTDVGALAARGPFCPVCEPHPLLTAASGWSPEGYIGPPADVYLNGEHQRFAFASQPGRPGWVLRAAMFEPPPGSVAKMRRCPTCPRGHDTTPWPLCEVVTGDVRVVLA